MLILYIHYYNIYYLFMDYRLFEHFVILSSPRKIAIICVSQRPVPKKPSKPAEKHEILSRNTFHESETRYTNQFSKIIMFHQRNYNFH